MTRLAIIIASTRPGRVGGAVGEWFVDIAKRHGGFELDVVDLAELDLPFLDEPNHPRLRQYTKEHTKQWSERVDKADAFVFVTPEYNFGMPATLLNALDFLSQEWANKAVGFVSYGGVSGGTRGVQMTKQIVTTLKMFPLPAAVSIPFVQQFVVDGKIEPNDIMNDSAETVLNEIATVEEALVKLR